MGKLIFWAAHLEIIGFSKPKNWKSKIPPLIWKNIWFLCPMCWVVFLYPFCSYPISISAFTLHYCSLIFPKQHFSLSLTSSSPKHSVIWNSLFPKQNFSFFFHFALILTWDGQFNERNSSISLSNRLSLAHCHTYHRQYLFFTIVAAFSVATSRSKASTSLCYLSQRSKPETL